MQQGTSPSRGSGGGSAGHRVLRKIALLGFRGVGKTSIARRLAEDNFETAYAPTIISTYHTTFQVQNVQFDLELVDTAGQDEFTRIPSEASVGIHGYLLVYDVTSKPSFDKVQHIRESLIERIGAESVPAVLVANKNDMDKRRVSYEQGCELAKKWKYPFMETSARNADNIEQIFVTLLQEIEKESGLLKPKNEKKDKICSVL
eukprot:gb/GECG01012309.1/.p1 GENE.gb/GECG01012309.1/~~gb/GECG01012309.1/.p1  ORF type:complete len:203 (+),score=32.10 gb/GECG01012309.1/:1-609(+)